LYFEIDENIIKSTNMHIPKCVTTESSCSTNTKQPYTPNPGALINEIIYVLWKG
jgi:hypothetical protein